MGKIHKIVGLEGLARSGKTTTLRAFVDALLKKGWRKETVWAYTRYMNKTLEDIPSEGDYMVLLKRYNNHIVVVTGGDYPKRVSIILKVVLELDVDIDILYSAMRMKNSNVVDSFKDEAMARNIPMDDKIFIPGFTGSACSYPAGYLDKAQGVYVARMMEIARKVN